MLSTCQYIRKTRAPYPTHLAYKNSYKSAAGCNAQGVPDVTAHGLSTWVKVERPAAICSNFKREILAYVQSTIALNGKCRKCRDGLTTRAVNGETQDIIDLLCGERLELHFCVGQPVAVVVEADAVQ